MKLPSLSSKIPILILRTITGVIILTHGLARVYYQSVSDFGSFLDSKGLIIGFLLAWIVTIGEIVAGTLIIVGYRIRYCVIFEFIVIALGIILVHSPNGWFVVGHGTNGIEYSVLLLAVLLFLYSTD